MLRTAFATTMKDPALLEDAKRVRYDIEPVSGEMLQRAADAAFAASPEAIARAKELLAPN